MATCDLIQAGIHAFGFGPEGKVWVGSIFGVYAYDGRQGRKTRTGLIGIGRDRGRHGLGHPIIAARGRAAVVRRPALDRACSSLA